MAARGSTHCRPVLRDSPVSQPVTVREPPRVHPAVKLFGDPCDRLDGPLHTHESLVLIALHDRLKR